MTLQVGKGHLSFEHLSKTREEWDNFEMSFTLGPNDLVSRVTFFFFFRVFPCESNVLKRQRAR